MPLALQPTSHCAGLLPYSTLSVCLSFSLLPLLQVARALCTWTRSGQRSSCYPRESTGHNPCYPSKQRQTRPTNPPSFLLSYYYLVHPSSPYPTHARPWKSFRPPSTSIPSPFPSRSCCSS
ncbi:hypothetical protein F5Y19DRAFT_125332 [Xylariaceae sp. FL1651]|nr:hypothetical protein F5Y19DRAFT_125332 [Xylariaceae sp. FL1651]